MNNSLSPKRLHGTARIHLIMQSGVMFALFLLSSNMPRKSVAFPILLGTVCFYYLFKVEREACAVQSGTEERWFLAALLGFTGYLFLNSLWSLAPLAALGKSAFVLLIILMCLLVSRALSQQPREVLERTAHFAVIGCVIGTLIAAFEFSTDHYLARMLYTYFPALRPGDNTIRVMLEIDGKLSPALPESEFKKAYDNVVIDVVSDGLNRNLSLLMFLFWPALFLAVNHVKHKLAILFAGIIALATAITIYTGHSQTAQVALVLGAATLLAARFWPTFTHRGILATWCIAVMLALPLAAAPYKAGLHTAEWMPVSFRDRMTIWDTTVEHAVKTPWLGIGIRSTRVVGKEFVKTQTKLPGHVAKRRLGIHSHNQFLQIWFELGFAGALFVLAIGIGLLRGISRMHETLKPYAYASFVSICTIAAFGWGLWQTWLLSGYALAVMMIIFANNYANRLSRDAR